MSFFERYLTLHFKRTAKVYAVVLVLTLLLLMVVALVGYTILQEKRNDVSFQKMQIGIVGDQEDKLLQMGISMLQVVDTSRFTVEFYTFDSEEDAIQSVQNRKIGAYVVVPEGFAKSLVNGENKKLTYVLAQSGASMSSLLTRDVLDVVSNYIIETQAGATAMCDYAESVGYAKADVKSIDLDLSMQYIELVAQRERFATVSEVGLGENLSFVGYYICGLTVFFLLCFGVAGCTLRVKNSAVLDKVLYAKGYGVFTQVLGEYIPYLVATLATLMLPFSLAGVVSCFVDFGVQELKYYLLCDYMLLPLKLLPAIFLITAMQFLLYELVSGVIHAVLLQFTCAIIMGYVSGCFYPIYFMPESIQKVANLLPSGIAIDFFASILSENLDVSRLWICLLYGTVLFLLSVLVRRIRICKSEVQG